MISRIAFARLARFDALAIASGTACAPESAVCRAFSLFGRNRQPGARGNGRLHSSPNRKRFWRNKKI
jgi:hypothetical protein